MFFPFIPALVDRDAIEEMHLGVDDEDLEGLEGFFKGIELIEELRLGIMEDLPCGILTEEGIDVFKTNKIKPRVSMEKRGKSNKLKKKSWLK